MNEPCSSLRGIIADFLQQGTHGSWGCTSGSSEDGVVDVTLSRSGGAPRADIRVFYSLPEQCVQMVVGSSSLEFCWKTVGDSTVVLDRVADVLHAVSADGYREHISETDDWRVVRGEIDLTDEVITMETRLPLR